jgi:hypothetical protein
MSFADENWPSASRPVTFTAWVLVRPRLAACWFISSANCASPPAMSRASRRAASLALTMSIARIRRSRGSSWPSPMPIRDSSGSTMSPAGAVTTFTGLPAAYAVWAASSLTRLPTGSWASALLAADRNPPRRMS